MTKILVWTGFRNDFGVAPVEKIIDLDDYEIPKSLWDDYSQEEKNDFILNEVLNFGFMPYDEERRGIYE